MVDNIVKMKKTPIIITRRKTLSQLFPSNSLSPKGILDYTHVSIKKKIDHGNQSQWVDLKHCTF